MASVAITLAARSVLRASDFAAATAYAPPEPIPTMPSSGSITSPVPDKRKVDDWSATTSMASRRLRMRSVRQSLANSTTDRSRFPR